MLLGQMLQRSRCKPTSAGGLRGSGILKRASLQAVGFKGRSLRPEPTDQRRGGSCGEGRMQCFGRE